MLIIIPTTTTTILLKIIGPLALIITPTMVILTAGLSIGLLKFTTTIIPKTMPILI